VSEIELFSRFSRRFIIRFFNSDMKSSGVCKPSNIKPLLVWLSGESSAEVTSRPTDVFPSRHQRTPSTVKSCDIKTSALQFPLPLVNGFCHEINLRNTAGNVIEKEGRFLN
jgi:hypothetical protein